ncbi:uncharacterized protein LOC132184645 isoform X2 [Corylus avellana]|uniref:uncharacterized protein LOC132184645 isoform X2 n=1 Tax=Corylus avellana TaxID=13451 RepID=UPI00286A9F36|nr:uncharacterized protein LOC132184645 isoform X2 [Corylus avellana]
MVAEMEGLHGMKRKQLQALCKKHGVPANLTNRQMADRLSLLLKEEGNPIIQGQSCSNDLGEISSENESKVVDKNAKKVRFSPENETFIFVGSGSDSDSDKDYTPVKKRAGRTRSTVNPVPKKQVQVVENAGEMGVSGKITNGPGRITRSTAQEVVQGDAVPFVRKKRPRRSAEVEGMEVKDVRVSDNVAGFINAHDMVTRGSRKTRNARGNDGVVLLNDVSEDNGNVGEGAEHEKEKLAKRSRRNVRKEKGSAALSREMEKVEIVGKMTRSRTQLEGKASAVASGTKTVEVQEECESVLQLEEPLKGLSREGSKRKSAPQKGRVKSKILAGEGAEPGKVLRRSKRNATIDKDSELLTGDLRKIKAFDRTRGPEVQLVEKASAVESECETLVDQEECEEEVPQLEEPLKGPGAIESRQESVAPQKAEKVRKRPLPKKETRKRSRNADVEGASEVEPSVEPTKENEKEHLLNGRPRRSKRITFNSGAPAVGELGNHETVGIKKSRESLQEGKFYAAEERLRRSSRNASRNNSILISDEVDGVADGARKDGQMKRKRKPNPKEECSVTDSEHVIERSSRRSSHNALKSELVAPAALSCKAVEIEQQNRRQSMILEDDPCSKSTWALEDPPILDTGSAILDTVGHQIDPDSCCIEEIPGKSIEKQKGSTMSSVKKGPHFLEVSAGNSDLKEVMDSTMTMEETLLPAPVKLQGVTTDQSTNNAATESVVVNEDSILLDVEGELPLDDITDGDMDDRSCPLNSIGEASNLSDLKRRLETEEPLIGENMNLRNDKEDGQSAGDDQSSVQDDKNLEYANEIAKPTIQELVADDHQSELRESMSSIRNIKHTSEKVDEISALDLFEGEEIAQAEVFVGAADVEQAIPDSNYLLTAEIDEGISGHSATVATPFRPAPESQVSGISNEVIDHSLHTSSPEKDALEEEENQPGAQSVAQSTTMIERSSKNYVGAEKYSGGMEIPNETICIDETSVSNEMRKIRTVLNMTNENENEEALLSGGGSPASDEDLINSGFEQNLRMDGGCLPDLDNRDCQAAEEKENEVSEGKSDKFSDATRVSCMHNLSSGGRISPIIPEERDTGRVETIPTTILGLQSLGSARKGISSGESTCRKDIVEQEEEGIHLKDQIVLSVNDRSAIGSGVALLHEAENSVVSTVKVVDTAEDKRETRSAQTDSKYGSPKDAAKEGVKSGSLTHFSLELLGGNRNESADVQNILDETLSPNSVEACSPERSAEEKATSNFHGSEAFSMEASTAMTSSELFLENLFDHEEGVTSRNSCVEPLDYMTSSNKSMGSKGMANAEELKGESFLEQHDHIGKEENSGCSQQVELGDHGGWEVNQSADTNSVENTVEMVKATSEFIGGIDKLEEEKSPAVLERQSDAVFIDDAFQQVTSGEFGGHFAEGEDTEFSKSTDDDNNFRSNAIVPYEIAYAVTLEKMGRTQSPATPATHEKAFDGCGNEFPTIDATSVSPSNEVLFKDHEVLEETSKEVVQTVFLVDEVRFGNLDNQKIEDSPELDKSASIGSDCLMDHKPADRSANFGTVDEDQELNDDSFEAQKEDSDDDNIQFIPEDNVDGLVEKEHGENGGDYDALSDHTHENTTVAADEAGARSIGRKKDSEKVEDGAKWVENTPVSVQLFDCSSKWDEKDTEKTNSYADTSCGKPETHPSSVIVSLPRVSSSHGDENRFDIFIERSSYGTKGKEMTDDGRADDEISVGERVGAQQNEGLVDSTVETSATFSKKFTEEQLDGLNGGVTQADHNSIDYLTLNEPLCSSKTSNVDETDEALGFSNLDVMVVRGDYSGGCAGSEKLHVITSEKYEMGANHIALSPVIALPSFGTEENSSLEFHLGSHIFTSWEMNLISGDAEQGNVEISNEAPEANLTSKHSESSVKMKETAMISEKDQQDSEKLLGELEHQAHFAASDEPICRDGGRSNMQHDISAIDKEHIDCENYESSCVSTHLIKAAEINGFNNASARPMAESTPEESDIGCHSVVEKLVGVNYSEDDVALDHTHENFRVVTDQVSETSMDATTDSENIQDLIECVEKTQISANRTKSGTETDEKYSADVKIAVETSCGRRQMGRSCATTLLDVSSLHVNGDNSYTGLSAGEEHESHTYNEFLSNDSEGKEMADEDGETKALELHDDSHAFTSWEMDLFLGDVEQDEVEKSDGGALVANSMSKNSEDANEETRNVDITEQIAEEQHGDHEHHMAEDVSQMEGTHLAVSHEPICQNHDGSNKQGEIAAITEGNVVCENRSELIKGEILNNFKYSELLMDAAEINGSNRVIADEAMAECGHNELKRVENIANPDAEDIKLSAEMDDYEHMVEAVELSQDLPKINTTMEEISPASTNMVVGRDIAAEVAQTPQLKLGSPKKMSPDTKLKENIVLPARQLNSSMVKGTKCKTSQIPRTPKNLLKTYNTKENTPSIKNDQIGNITAMKTLPKRRPLEDLQNN